MLAVLDVDQVIFSTVDNMLCYFNLKLCINHVFSFLSFQVISIPDPTLLWILASEEDKYHPAHAAIIKYSFKDCKSRIKNGLSPPSTKQRHHYERHNLLSALI